VKREGRGRAYRGIEGVFKAKRRCCRHRILGGELRAGEGDPRAAGGAVAEDVRAGRRPRRERRLHTVGEISL
jgi:hypothetical protein